MLPVLAYNEFVVKQGRDVKWILYGDDDTIFFTHGVNKLLEGLDHNMPYFIAGETLQIHAL